MFIDIYFYVIFVLCQFFFVINYADIYLFIYLVNIQRKLIDRNLIQTVIYAVFL